MCIMYVNKILFLLNQSRGVQFLPMQTEKTLAFYLNHAKSLYSRASYAIQTMMMDMEFKM